MKSQYDVLFAGIQAFKIALSVNNKSTLKITLITYYHRIRFLMLGLL